MPVDVHIENKFKKISSSELIGNSHRSLKMITVAFVVVVVVVVCVVVVFVVIFIFVFIIVDVLDDFVVVVVVVSVTAVVHVTAPISVQDCVIFPLL